MVNQYDILLVSLILRKYNQNGFMLDMKNILIAIMR